MVTTVSVGEFRKNISSYLDQVSSGATVIIKDNKRNKNIAQVQSQSVFNKSTYLIALDNSQSTLSAKRYSQWKSKKHISAWLQNSRLSDDRTFE